MATPEPARNGDRARVKPVVAVGGPHLPVGGNGNGLARDESPGNGDRGSRTLLLTSAEPGEGKTFVAANLAATLASYGQRVTVMSCDKRNPSIYRLLGVPGGPGPQDDPRSTTGVVSIGANGHAHETGVPGVRLLDGPVSAWQFGRDADVRADVDGARQGADCVLIDMPPMLIAGDASRLLWNVDAVVIVARAGVTTARMARRSVEVLDLVSAPVLGVVLNDAPEANLPRRFRGYR